MILITPTLSLVGTSNLTARNTLSSRTRRDTSDRLLMIFHLFGNPPPDIIVNKSRLYGLQYRKEIAPCQQELDQTCKFNLTNDRIFFIISNVSEKIITKIVVACPAIFRGDGYGTTPIREGHACENGFPEA